MQTFSSEHPSALKEAGVIACLSVCGGFFSGFYSVVKDLLPSSSIDIKSA